MSKITLSIVFFLGLTLPAAAQQADIEAANAKWIDCFNKGDFDGLAAPAGSTARTSESPHQRVGWWGR